MNWIGALFLAALITIGFAFCSDIAITRCVANTLVAAVGAVRPAGSRTIRQELQGSRRHAARVVAIGTRPWRLRRYRNSERTRKIVANCTAGLD